MLVLCKSDIIRTLTEFASKSYEVFLTNNFDTVIPVPGIAGSTALCYMCFSGALRLQDNKCLSMPFYSTISMNILLTNRAGHQQPTS